MIISVAAMAGVAIASDNLIITPMGLPCSNPNQVGCSMGIKGWNNDDDFGCPGELPVLSLNSGHEEVNKQDVIELHNTVDDTICMENLQNMKNPSCMKLGLAEPELLALDVQHEVNATNIHHTEMHAREKWYLSLWLKTPKKAKISNYISNNYYNTCKLLTTKEAKMRKLKEEEARELEELERKVKNAKIIEGKVVVVVEEEEEEEEEEEGRNTKKEKRLTRVQSTSTSTSTSTNNINTNTKRRRRREERQTQKLSEKDGR
ncbi:hypothetical protein F4604DRAFT_1901479 [Suillus subluteus]|nr:hypothetical protein F4604DRAFT_1901479 [Suillus subluteus]